jgi:hypothetical protein
VEPWGRGGTAVDWRVRGASPWGSPPGALTCGSAPRRRGGRQRCDWALLRSLRRWLRCVMYGGCHAGRSPFTDEACRLAPIASSAAGGKVAFPVGPASNQRDDMVKGGSRSRAVGAGFPLPLPLRHEFSSLSVRETGSERLALVAVEPVARWSQCALDIGGSVSAEDRAVLPRALGWRVGAAAHQALSFTCHTPCPSAWVADVARA